jgi:two-component system, NtrC family, nitrogen regulation sensor histidine kinase NtrY
VNRRRAFPLEARVGVLLVAFAVCVVIATLAVVAGVRIPAVRLPPAARWLIGAGALVTMAAILTAIRASLVDPLRALANVVRGIREGDYAIRATGASPRDALGLVALETNLLADQLHRWRLGELEAAALLRTVMAEIDVAVFAFDAEGRLRLANRAGERLLGMPAPRLLGQDAASLGLAEAVVGESRVAELTFAGAAGRWGIHRAGFRQDGRPHTLLVITDLSRALREEQLAAWQQLVRVLSHEINNSLAPIQSIAHTLRGLVQRESPPPDLGADVARGLGVIAARSEALARFLSSYARLAQLPALRSEVVDVPGWVRRAAALETRLTVDVVDGPAVTVAGDADQLDQVLINLVRNAADAALETGGGVRIRWRTAASALVVEIEDDGPGVASPANVFTPFFTTKPDGSGIGLALSRQIVEAHGGSVTLVNREAAVGCVATIRLPGR